MKKKELDKLGVIKGQMVTDDVLKAVGDKLPKAAIVELWKGRTINRRCLRAIDAAIKDAEPVKPKPAEKDGE